MTSPSQVKAHMTPSPHTIGNDQTLATAARVMNEHGIRHLPVLHGGHLVGILSQRDIELVETLRNVDPRVVTVEEAMTPSPYVVGPDTPLVEVVRHMVEKKYGSAIVADRSKVIGVFTTIDAMMALAGLLGARIATPQRASTTAP